ncbi:MAG: Rpn family recombination-promoting nuclease/putative transposase [Synergistaceae bacterium]|nr:Rpn family recombination-promoting nuclease/putative transposase [Synergistaceae bacterium]
MAVRERKEKPPATGAEVRDGAGIEKTGMGLLPLRSDLIFKLVFGDRRYIGIMRAFLLAALDIPAGEYEGLEIVDPHLERDRPDDKLGILDVRLQLTNRKLISVEIQVREVPFMAERVAFSTGRNLSRQIFPGQSYGQIARVVTIVIANYNMIVADNFYHHIFRLYDGDKGVLLTDAMEIRTLELGKLPEARGVGEKENELLDWLRLIRSEREEEIEMLATKTPEMKMAVGRLKKLSLDERTRMLCEAREMAIMDEMARNEAALAKGLTKGREEGREEGRTKGREEGEHNKAREVALKMLARGLEPGEVAEISGLSPDEMEALRR